MWVGVGEILLRAGPVFRLQKIGSNRASEGTWYDTACVSDRRFARRRHRPPDHGGHRGLGLAPSAEVGERHALFQPSHGTAPPWAGRHAADPLAMILSAAMTCDWLAEKHADPRTAQAGRAFHTAVERVLAERRDLTLDPGGRRAPAKSARP